MCRQSIAKEATDTWKAGRSRTRSQPENLKVPKEINRSGLQRNAVGRNVTGPVSKRLGGLTQERAGGGGSHMNWVGNSLTSHCINVVSPFAGDKLKNPLINCKIIPDTHLPGMGLVSTLSHTWDLR